MRRWPIAALVAAGAVQAAAAAERVDPRVYLTQYKCYLCHADREAKAGPAYVDVARRFQSRPDATSRLAAEIRHGLHRGGPWHMPPHPEVAPAEARAMARYIMSLAPPPGTPQ